MKITRNVKLDAVMLHAAMNGLFVPCAIHLGFTANEAFVRAEWLKKQDNEYIESVVSEVLKIEIGGLND